MNHCRARTLAAACVLLAIAGCTSSGTASQPAARHSRTPSPVSSPATPSPSGTVPGLAAVHDPGQVTGTLHGPCHAQGQDPAQLPDRSCTPGAYDPVITAAILCSGHYSTKAYRPPVSQTQAFKYNQAYPAYSIPRTTRTELDHLVSLELGGANDAANLWPEVPPTPNPKDVVENALHAWVCAVSGAAGQDRLHKAQLAIAGNWTTAEKVLGVVTPASPAASSSVPPRPAPSSSVPPPVRITSSPPPAAAAPAPAACHPVTSGGNCYRAGEFCRESDHGASGIAGNGAVIRCEPSGGRWRWEPA